MIIDTSAVIAIMRREPDAADYAKAIEAAQHRRMSTANYLEAAVVADRDGDPVASRKFDELIRLARIVLEPVTETQVRTAREAYRDFGKSSRHPAGLNFGDCFSYALAKEFGEPLLFKGKDFAHTDIVSALPGE